MCAVGKREEILPVPQAVVAIAQIQRHRRRGWGLPAQ